MIDRERLVEMHGKLRDAWDILLTFYPVEAGMREDTAFALGQATGLISQAKALIGRDIDDAAKR
jgi:hypothetical protein